MDEYCWRNKVRRTGEVKTWGLTVVAALWGRDTERVGTARRPRRQRARCWHEVLLVTDGRVMFTELVLTAADVRTDTASKVVWTARRTLPTRHTCSPSECAQFLQQVRYDTVDYRALKSWRYGQLNLAYGRETKKITKSKNRVDQKKRSMKAVQGEEVNLRGVGGLDLWNR